MHLFVSLSAAAGKTIDTMGSRPRRAISDRIAAEMQARADKNMAAINSRITSVTLQPVDKPPAEKFVIHPGHDFWGVVMALKPISLGNSHIPGLTPEERFACYLKIEIPDIGTCAVVDLTMLPGDAEVHHSGCCCTVS